MHHFVGFLCKVSIEIAEIENIDKKTGYRRGAFLISFQLHNTHISATNAKYKPLCDKYHEKNSGASGVGFGVILDVGELKKYDEQKTILVSPYKHFLENYAKELYEIDAPMIAGAVERCIQKFNDQPPCHTEREEEPATWVWNEDCQCWVCSSCGASTLNDYAGRSADSQFCPHCGKMMTEANIGLSAKNSG